MAANSQNHPKGGRKDTKVRAFRPTHSTAKLIAEFEKAERRQDGAANEFLIELGLAVYLAGDQQKYRLPEADSGANV